LEISFEYAAGSWRFPCCAEFYYTIQLVNEIKRMQFVHIHCKYSYYAYYKKLLKFRTLVKSCKNFLLRAAVGPRSCEKKLERMLDM
jgi:hypothetical protein